MEVAEDHRLYDDGGSPCIGQVHLVAVDARLLGIPGIKNL